LLIVQEAQLGLVQGDLLLAQSAVLAAPVHSVGKRAGRGVVRRISVPVLTKKGCRPGSGGWIFSSAEEALEQLWFWAAEARRGGPCIPSRAVPEPPPRYFALRISAIFPTFSSSPLKHHMPRWPESRVDRRDEVIQR
jgi:hypothetical protein